MTNNSSYLLIQLVIKNGPNLASCQSLQVNSKWGCIRETVFTKQVDLVGITALEAMWYLHKVMYYHPILSYITNIVDRQQLKDKKVC